MPRKTYFYFSGFFAIFLVLNTFPSPAWALEKLIKGASPEVSPHWNQHRQQPAMEDSMLVVTDVLVDKTAANAVVAREEAMGEVRQLAFRMLAERHLSPSAYANLKMPDDMVIATLVQDFEIKSEQLSSTRYVANYTVRFRDAIRNYISIPVMPRSAYGYGQTQPGGQPDAGQDIQWQGATGNTVNHRVPAGTQTNAMMPATLNQGSVLILPYYENMAGETLLWEDPNPWRQMWQVSPPRQSNGKHQVIVPLGDIGDVAAGAADAVWSGNYTVVEKLRRQYGVEQVVLAVANKSGAYMTIDLHVFDGKALRRRNALTPYVGEKNDDEAWRQAMYEVISYLQRPQPGAANKIENISRSVTRPQLNVPEVNSRSITTYPTPDRPQAQATSRSIYSESYQPPAPYNGPRPALVVKEESFANNTAQAGDVAEDTDPYAASMNRFGIATEVEAAFAFSNFNDWMAVQKRLSSTQPPIRMDIRTISHNSARFVLRYNGNVDMLRQTLAGQGIGMTAAPSGAGAAQIYSLHLVQ